MLKKRFRFNNKYKQHILYSLISILVVSISSSLSILLKYLSISSNNSLLMLLLGVLGVIVFTKGYIYGVLASIISVFFFNYFFTDPLYSFFISDIQDIILLIFFLIASLITGSVATNYKKQYHIAKENEIITKNLYEITEKFVNLSGEEEIIKRAGLFIYEHTGVACKITLNKKIFNQECKYKHTEYTLTNPVDYEIMQRNGYNIGKIMFNKQLRNIEKKEKMIVNALIHQMAQALEREYINKEKEDIKISMESEHLKSTLLRSISHDIRTPLTGIMAASNYITDNINEIDKDNIKKLCEDINDETMWLIKTVQNILDMTKISEGRIHLNKKYESVDDIILQATSRSPKLMAEKRLITKTPEEIVLINVDGHLMVQVLVNLMDNAYKYAGDNTVVELKAFEKKDFLFFEVSDNGKGIRAEFFKKMFDWFETSNALSSDSFRGMGLGLPICKAIVEAHGGKIQAKKASPHGMRFIIKIPYEKRQFYEK